MKFEEIEHALDLLIYYCEHIVQNVDRLSGMLKSFKEVGSKGDILSNEYTDRIMEQIFSVCEKIYGLAEKENEVEKLLKKFDAPLYNELKKDIKTILADLESFLKVGNEFLLHLEKSREAIQVWGAKRHILGKDFGTRAFLEKRDEFVEKFESIVNNFMKIAHKDVYKEVFVKQYLELSKLYWERNIHNKYSWLYHGTSVLFLGNIKIYGLDNSKISNGIKRAIETVSKIYLRQGIRKEVDTKGFQDLNVELSKKPVSLVWHKDVIRAAKAPQLPAFLYELFDENNLNEEAKFALLSSLPKEERFMLGAIWRFGRILRKKSRMIVLYIKVDSDFLKYYNFPDFISSYDEFAEKFVYPYIKKTTDPMFYKRDDLLRNMSHAYGSIEGLVFGLFHERDAVSGGFGASEIFVERVPPQLIYVNVSGQLVPIPKVTEGMAPYIE